MTGAVLLALLLLPGAAAAADNLTGPARASAADTLVIGGTRFRLAGVAAPAADRLCGGLPCIKAARARLAALVTAGPVTCGRDTRLGHGVYEGTCRLADGRDLGHLLRAEGLLDAAP